MERGKIKHTTLYEAFRKLQKMLSPVKHTNTSNIWTEQVIFGVKRLKIKIG